MKGHVIAKLILGAVLAFVFAYLSLIIKESNETSVQEMKDRVTKQESTSFFDKIDNSVDILSIRYFYWIKSMSNNKVIIVSIVISFILVMLTDMIAGVGSDKSFFERQNKNDV
jgi:hypothetical protein